LDWSDQDIEGASRFLGRVHRLVARYADRLREVAAWHAKGESSELAPEERRLLRKAHQTLRRVTEDMEERWHFNTDVALAMTFYNELVALQEAAASALVRPEILKAALEILTLVLALFTPHLADELWEALGHEGSTLQVRWPAFDPALAAEEEVEIPVQVNGKLRARIRASASAGEDDLRAMAIAEPKIREHLNGRQVVKIVVVPGKLVNVVAK